MPRPKLSLSKAGRDIEHRAYRRAADLAKGYADHWEQEAQANPHNPDDDWFPAAAKAGHWRIIEKTIRALADKGSA